MGAKHHTVSDFRMTVADFVTGTTKSHTMQKAHVVSNDGGFTDNNVCGVVNQKSVTNFCCRMDVHAELAADNALKHLCRERAAFKPQGVGCAICLQPLETLKEQKRFQKTRACRIAKDRGIQVLACAGHQFRILKVKNPEDLLKFCAVNYLARQLTGQSDRKHRGKILAVKNLLRDHQYRKRFIVNQLLGFATNFLFYFFDGHFFALSFDSSSSSSRVGITLFSRHRFSSRILKVKSSRLFSNIF